MSGRWLVCPFRLHVPWTVHAARTLWITLLIGLTVKCLVQPTIHSVYPHYAAAGHSWWTAGTSASVSIAYLQRQYGPLFGDLIQPFCWLPDSYGGVLWTLVSLGVLLTGFHRLLKVLLPRPTEPAIGAAFLLLPWIGLASLSNGQANTLITGCLAWGMESFARRRWLRAGLWLALPACIKTYPAALPLLLAALFPRRFAGAFVIALIGLVSVPFLFHPAPVVLERYRDWVAFLTSGQHTTSGFVTMEFRALLGRWIMTVDPAIYVLVELFAGILVFAACWWLQHQPMVDERRLLQQAFLLTSCWLVLFGPATEEATYLLVSPAVAVMLLAAWQDGAAPMDRVVVVLAALSAGPLQTAILGEGFRRFVFDHKLAPLALTILFGRQLWQVARAARHPATIRRKFGAIVVSTRRSPGWVKRNGRRRSCHSLSARPFPYIGLGEIR